MRERGEGEVEVDRELVEAASGMGMREGEVLRRVEIPIALPVILYQLYAFVLPAFYTMSVGVLPGASFTSTNSCPCFAVLRMRRRMLSLHCNKRCGVGS